MSFSHKSYFSSLNSEKYMTVECSNWVTIARLYNKNRHSRLNNYRVRLNTALCFTEELLLRN